MTTFLYVLILGTFWGGLYGLIAVGFTLIFGVAGIVNFAHGSFYMLGAYLAYTFIAVLKINVPLSVLMAVAATFLLGIIVDRFGIKPMRERVTYVFIFTLAFAMFLQQLMYAIYGPYGKAVPDFVKGQIIFKDLQISYQKVLIFLIAGILVTLLCFFIKKTKTGKSISAVAQNRDAATYVGIRPERVYNLTMAIAAGLAAVAGAFIAPVLEADPTMWVFPLFKAFAIVIIGGLGSLEGAIIAALLLGYSETIVGLLYSVKYADMVYLIAIVIVLILRPRGFLGKRSH